MIDNLINRKYIYYLIHFKLYWGVDWKRLSRSNTKNVIEGIHVEEVANISSRANYGIHYMVIYSDLTTLREFYSYYIKKGIE
jgi:hypothetical protein